MPKVESKSMKETLHNMENLAIKISEPRKKAGLPELDGVELQNEYKDTPIPQHIKDRVQKRIAAYNAKNGK